MTPHWLRSVHTYLSALAVTLCLASSVAAGSEEGHNGLRVNDLPKPIPQAMEKIREVGNDVGKGISKATSAGASAARKVLKEQRSHDEGKPSERGDSR